MMPRSCGPPPAARSRQRGARPRRSDSPVGPRVDSLWVIEDGLTPTDKVVVEGLQRIQDGMTVTAKAAPPIPVPAKTEAVTTAGETAR